MGRWEGRSLGEEVGEMVVGRRGSGRVEVVGRGKVCVWIEGIRGGVRIGKRKGREGEVRMVRRREG